MSKTKLIRPLVIQYHIFNYNDSESFNWTAVMSSNLVSDWDEAENISKSMIKILYQMIDKGEYEPKIKFIKNFDKNKIHYEEGDYAIQYLMDNGEYTAIFHSVCMHLQQYERDDKNRYDYWEADEAFYSDLSNVGSYFVSYFDKEYYAIALDDWKSGVVGRANSLDVAISKLEDYISKFFDYPECMYCESNKEGNIWISKKEQ